MYHYAVGNKTHGPVPLEALRGVITPDTLVWREGMDQWQPASELAELELLLVQTPLVTAEAVDAGGSAATSGKSEIPARPVTDVRSHSAATTPVVVQYARVDLAATHPGMAIASMVLGIICVPMLCAWPLSLVCAVLAIVFGFVARGQCARENRTGGGMALAGIILGALPLGIVLIFVLIALLAAASAAVGI